MFRPLTGHLQGLITDPDVSMFNALWDPQHSQIRGMYCKKTYKQQYLMGYGYIKTGVIKFEFYNLCFYIPIPHKILLFVCLFIIHTFYL